MYSLYIICSSITHQLTNIRIECIDKIPGSISFSYFINPPCRRLVKWIFMSLANFSSQRSHISAIQPVTKTYFTLHYRHHNNSASFFFAIDHSLTNLLLRNPSTTRRQLINSRNSRLSPHTTHFTELEPYKETPAYRAPLPFSTIPQLLFAIPRQKAFKCE